MPDDVDRDKGTQHTAAAKLCTTLVSRTLVSCISVVNYPLLVCRFLCRFLVWYVTFYSRNAWRRGTTLRTTTSARSRLSSRLLASEASRSTLTEPLGELEGAVDAGVGGSGAEGGPDEPDAAERGQSNALQAALNIVAEVMGAGILSLPYACAKVGWVAGLGSVDLSRDGGRTPCRGGAGAAGRRAAGRRRAEALGGRPDPDRVSGR